MVWIEQLITQDLGNSSRHGPISVLWTTSSKELEVLFAFHGSFANLKVQNFSPVSQGRTLLKFIFVRIKCTPVHEWEL